MTDKIIYREFGLNIKHYKGDQTPDELRKPCDKCIFRCGEDCKIFDAPIRNSQRPCISTYRIDLETLIEAMQEKVKKDNEDFVKWINSYSDYMEPEDGELFVIKNPDDMIRLYEDLEQVGE